MKVLESCGSNIGARNKDILEQEEINDVAFAADMKCVPHEDMFKTEREYLKASK